MDYPPPHSFTRGPAIHLVERAVCICERSPSGAGGLVSQGRDDADRSGFLTETKGRGCGFRLIGNVRLALRRRLGRIRRPVVDYRVAIPRLGFTATTLPEFFSMRSAPGEVVRPFGITTGCEAAIQRVRPREVRVSSRSSYQQVEGLPRRDVKLGKNVTLRFTRSTRTAKQLEDDSVNSGGNGPFFPRPRVLK